LPIQWVSFKTYPMIWWLPLWQLIFKAWFSAQIALFMDFF
jgi:hypothetical protein